MRDSEREQIKLTAAFLNNLAVACVTLGFVSPLIAALFKLVNAPQLGVVLLFGIGWMSIAVALHAFAVMTLKDLDR